MGQRNRCLENVRQRALWMGWELPQVITERRVLGAETVGSPDGRIAASIQRELRSDAANGSAWRARARRAAPRSSAWSWTGQGSEVVVA
jgi:hypothetical protein